MCFILFYFFVLLIQTFKTHSVSRCVRPVQAVGKLHRHPGEAVQLRVAAGSRGGLSSSKHLEVGPSSPPNPPRHCSLTTPWTVNRSLTEACTVCRTARCMMLISN